MELLKIKIVFVVSGENEQRSSYGHSLPVGSR